MARTVKSTHHGKHGAIRNMTAIPGFTLVELMISLSITLMVTAGVLTFFVSFAKASLTMSSYAEFEAENRKFLQYFSQDVRDAEEVIWTSDHNVTLVSQSIQTTYAYDTSLQTVTRTVLGDQPQIMAEHLLTLEFLAYDQDARSVDISAGTTAADTDTKMIQITGESSKLLNSGRISTADLHSARYMMRNKNT